MKRINLLILSAILIAVVISLIFFDFVNRSDVTYAKQIICKANQKKIYSALLKYNEEYEIIPSGLKVLVQQGYLSEDNLYCPFALADSNLPSYKYFPQNFGDPNLILISDKISHMNKNQQVFIQTFGDGRAVININSESGCKKDVMIRVANGGDVELQEVLVKFPSQTETYGNISPGQTTAYRKIDKAYRYARIHALVNGKEAVLMPTDYVGEELLSGGNYTYVLKNNPKAVENHDRLRFELVIE